MVREARRHRHVEGEGGDGRYAEHAAPLEVRRQSASGGAGEAVREGRVVWSPGVAALGRGEEENAKGPEEGLQGRGGDRGGVA